MVCPLTTEQLVAFHFGKIRPNERITVEAHLAACQACLSEFFSLKGDIEDAANANDRPTAAVRQRILSDAASFLAERQGVPTDRFRSHQGISFGKTHASPLYGLSGGGVMARSAKVFVALAAAAVVTVLTFAALQRLEMFSPPRHSVLQTFDKTIDSGGMNPGHINTL